MLQRGNIDLHHRPVVHNPDGTISTVRSISIGLNHGKTALIPTVVGHRVVSNEQAIKHYQRTGQHLGIFDKWQNADAYAQHLHEAQAREYKKFENGPATTAKAPAKQYWQRPYGVSDAAWRAQQKLGDPLSEAAVKRGERYQAKEKAKQKQRYKVSVDRFYRQHPSKQLGFGEYLHGVRQRAGQLGGETAHAALSIPGGIVATAKAGGEDVGSAAHGDLSFKRSRAIAAAMGTQVYHDVQHPYRHPGYTFMDILALGTAGAGSASRLGAAGRALGEGAGTRAALLRSAGEGGSLLRRPAAGSTSLQLGGLKAERPLPDNPLLQPLAKLHANLRQKQLERPQQAGERAPFGRAENVMGRALAARRKTNSHIAQGEADLLLRQTKHLSKPEQTALRVVAIEGHQALRQSPEVLQRHINTHLREAQSAASRVDKLGHERIAQDLIKAAPVLANPSARFLSAVDATRAFSEALSKRAVERNLLTPSAAKSSLETLSKAYGREGAAKGSFYFPTHERFIPSAQPVGKAAYAPRPGQFGVGPPQTGRYALGTLKHRTGKGLKRGVVENVPKALAQVHAGREKLYSAQGLYRDALRASTGKKVSDFQIPIRRTRAISPMLRRQISADLEKARGGDTTAMSSAIKRLQDEISPAEHANAKVGAEVPGVRWVDRRLLKDVAEMPEGTLEAGFRKINAPFRTFGVYGRPAYIANNYPQNLAMLAVHHGLRAPSLLAKATRANKVYGRELTHRIEAAMGTSRTESFVPRGHVTGATHKVVSGVSRLTDRQPRVAAFIARAEQKGYGGREGMERLFHDPNSQNDLHWISEKAKGDMVNFDVSQAEKALSSLIYFYPWLSRSTVWAGKTALNRPIKTAALVQMARTPQAEQILLKNVPSWAQGDIKLGDKVYNPSPMGLFSTQGQIIQDLTDKNKSIAEKFGSPTLQLLGAQQGQAGLEAARLTAPGLLAQRMGLMGKPSKAFPDHGLLPSVLPAVGGAWVGRKADLGYMAEQAKKEMSPGQKLAALKSEQDTHLKNLVRKGELPPKYAPELRQALNLYNQRELLSKEIEKSTKKGEDRERQKLLGVIDLLAKSGKIPKGKVSEYKHWAKTTNADAKALRAARTDLWDQEVGPAISWYRDKAGAND